MLSNSVVNSCDSKISAATIHCMKNKKKRGKGRPPRDPYVALNLNIDAELKRQVATRAVNRGMTLTASVEEALRLWLAAT